MNNITRHLFAHSLRGLLGSLAVCVLMAYGISGIIYFTTEFIYITEDSFLYTVGIISGNILDALVALVVCQVVMRYRQGRLPQRWQQYMVVVLATLALATLMEWVLWLALSRLSGGGSLPFSPESALPFKVSPVAVAALYYFLWERYKQLGQTISDQAYQLLQLEKLRTKAELDALQARVNPHFLFNALNSIAGLVTLDPARAEEMTLLLAKLFRYTTSVANSPLNSVHDELDIVRTYLDIEQVRFQERLTYSVQVSPGLDRLLIPRFLLQPLVENAVKHGISRLADKGHIHVSIARQGPEILLAVHDNGPTFPDDFLPGYGLQSIQDKLRLLYGPQAALTIHSHPRKQVQIAIAAHLLTPSDSSYGSTTDRRRAPGPAAAGIPA
ncbi:Histidine kinase [Hymenobacter daecheongensis DSM 21074]|uniref:Histidine kinase n=1 Tax=Hymenobacter daecheongensis DSM 21074 TaxID=1121955 RepID=A0A1M6IWP8_9BACT|nr:histidine kinase [Hymenobacter daecheongensis]SHJ38870.1 Histidine kinase [Hymenobacter daecheongensis DSM 21074]